MQQDQLTNLILQSRNNNEAAFRKLVEAHQSMVFAYAFRLLCNEDDADDLVQETFIRVWKHLTHFNFEMKFKTWLFKIATNLCYDKLRANKRKQHFQLLNINVLEQIYSAENIETTFSNSELARIIKMLTNELTPKQKLVFTLCDLECLEVAEITAITGLSAAKIKSNLYLARQYIRLKLEKL
jgi:RNA polymerase sigma-70 factor, ECF subfamily